MNTFSYSEKMADLSNLKNVACEAIDKAADDLYKVSHDIWSHPELGYKEHFAHETLTNFLEKHKFPVDRHYLGMETAFRATVGEGSPHVFVLCEYDALPDIGHACGHNLIAEVGVAAGLGIKAAMEISGQSMGKLTVLGTPAEEGGFGKVDLMEKGAFKDASIALMAHPYTHSGSRCSSLAIDMCEVEFTGRASHAAGFPWEGINALDAVVIAYNNISCLRQQMQPEWRVHGIISNGGSRPNVIPEKASLEYFVRAKTRGELSILKEKMIKCFNAAADATGCTVEVKWAKNSSDNVLINPTLIGLYEDNARNIGVDVNDKHSHCSGSTDFGAVSHLQPSIHPLFYIGENVYNHTREFTRVAGSKEAQKYTLDEAKALAMTAIDVMCQPKLLDDMNREFHNDIEKGA